MRNPRIWLAGGVLVAAAAIGAVLIATGGSDDGGEGAGKPLRTTRANLTLERAVQPEAGYEEVVVSLPNERLNNAQTTGGAKSVLLTCADEDGRTTIRQRHRWPLVEEPGYPPHIHQPAGPTILGGLRSCRVTGRGVDFAGQVEGRLPRFQPPR